MPEKYQEMPEKLSYPNFWGAFAPPDPPSPTPLCVIDIYNFLHTLPIY